MSQPVAVINLASDPFRRERAQNAVYVLICAGLVLSLLVITGLILRARAEASMVRAQIHREQLNLEALRQEETRYASVLSRPSNADVFAQSVFLNELIARRAVSWTRVFEDLQTVMPANMRLEAIRLPQVPSQDKSGVNRVQLDMNVGADKADTIIVLLKKLENSPLFGSATVVSQTPPTQNDPFFKYRVSVAYAQKL